MNTLLCIFIPGSEMGSCALLFVVQYHTHSCSSCSGCFGCFGCGFQRAVSQAGGQAGMELRGLPEKHSFNSCLLRDLDRQVRESHRVTESHVLCAVRYGRSLEMWWKLAPEIGSAVRRLGKHSRQASACYALR
ncbi:hypothetical protein SKAU_G00112140 [Synaphobranchus kaupii]|uniref:Uncharacterized protein n=1 Tax=Synaphobranchus kaupii TaxID=118154 RepID=A0A9Q1G0Q3_SYNKA|nr:hypothetical protein SKAU_G00112140 [Synaphobranchus kaupii]